jgi:hypothetical protein
MRAALGLLLMGALAAGAAELRYAPDTGRVEIVSAGRAVMASPPEGLWSVACGWSEGWPSEWRHARPAAASKSGGWTVLRGEVEACGGRWILEDAYRPAGFTIRGVRRFTWKGLGAAPKVTLSVRFETLEAKATPLLPGILYSGNPSGARSGRVPVYGGKAGEQAIFEEHRYPMPYAFVELDAARGRAGAALHTIPSPAPFGNLKDQWWSLGIQALGNGRTELVLLSGPCASNGRRSVVKAIQPGFKEYDHAWLNLPPAGTIYKEFRLEAFAVEREGSGFARPTATSLEIFAPHYTGDMPPIAEIVRDKYVMAKSRWHDAGDAAGFRKYPDRNYYVMGWCGQAEAPGYALLVLGEGLGDPEARRMATRSLDFLAGAKFYEGGFHTWYDYVKKEWSRHEPLSQGQAMLSFANAIRVGRKGRLDTARWEGFLRKAAEFHATRILAAGWKPVSTDQAFFIAPLVRSFELFGDERFRRAALKAAEVYAARHLDMREPYWGGTLDASCEDKEGAYAALQGFLAVYGTTRDPEHLRWARHANDVVLTYLVVWDIDQPPGRLRDQRLRTRGWTVVSPQNQHIDAFGALIAADVFRLARELRRGDLEQIALLMFRSCGQMIDPWGSQGEQLNQTNYVQRGQADDVFGMRGTYRDDWTVFWITAHFLNAAAQLAEMGVPVWSSGAE